MPPWADLGTIWNTLRELDVGDLPEEVMRAPKLALIGSLEQAGSLQAHLQRGPQRLGQPLTAAPIYRLPLSAEDLRALAGYDLRLLLVSNLEDIHAEGLSNLAGQPARLLTVVDAPLGTTLAVTQPLDPQAASTAQPAKALICPLDDAAAVQEILWPAVVGQLPGRELALARAYPALRPAVTHKLIQDTSLTNATYAFTTGIGEMVPILALPLAAADIVILTKNQILMAYKIALLMGEDGSLRQVLPKLAAVVGSGFIWRQVARELGGLIPGWGLIPKLAVSYAGTYATGQLVYQWYQTGEKLQGQALDDLLRDALERGREQATKLAARLRRAQETPAPLEGSGNAASSTLFAGGASPDVQDGVFIPSD